MTEPVYDKHGSYTLTGEEWKILSAGIDLPFWQVIRAVLGLEGQLAMHRAMTAKDMAEVNKAQAIFSFTTSFIVEVERTARASKDQKAV